MKKVLFVLVTFLFINQASSQTGTEFWFAAPDISAQHHKDGSPLNLHITAMYTTTVTISRPADPDFVPMTIEMSENSTEVFRLDSTPPFNLDLADIEVYSRDKGDLNFVQNKGFLIEASPAPITCFYEVQSIYNRDIISLKGDNALGTHFWVSTQNAFKNHGYSDDFSGFVVVATEDNTTVNINPNGNNLKHHGTTPFAVTLNKGETFAVRARNQMSGAHIMGVEVSSDKDIAITIYDDSMQMDDGGSWDLFADQTIPTALVGTEYLVMKGFVRDKPEIVNDGESIYIIATEGNTDIFIDGVYVDGIQNAGDYFRHVITHTGTHVKASKPVYVNHITGYADPGSYPLGGRELGGAVLPPINSCTGSHSVTIKKSPEPSGYAYFNNLMVRIDTSGPNKNKAIHNFTYSINGGPKQAINPNDFTYVMDSAFAIYTPGGIAYFNLVNDNDIIKIENPYNRFHLAVMSGNATGGCKYGYFSDYASSKTAVGVGSLQTDAWQMLCGYEPVQLIAAGGRRYEWLPFGHDSIADNLSSTSSAAPIFTPDENVEWTYTYNAVVHGECSTRDTFPVQLMVLNQPEANFTLDQKENCGELNSLVTNKSKLASSPEWTIYNDEGILDEFDGSSVGKNFQYTFTPIANKKQQYIELSVKNKYNECPDTKIDTLTIFESLEVDFDIYDTSLCSYAIADIVNTTIGIEANTSYVWKNNGNILSYSIHPEDIQFANPKNVNDTVDLMFIAKKEDICADSLVQKVIVHPYVVANITVNEDIVQSGTEVSLSSNSINANVQSWYIDDMFASSEAAFNHEFTAEDNATVEIQLVVENEAGCEASDSKQITIIPEQVNSITNLRLQEGIKVYANKNTIYLLNESLKVRAINLQVIGLSGQVFIQKEVMLENKFSLETDLPGGIYLLNLNSENKSSTFKIIIE